MLSLTLLSAALAFVPVDLEPRTCPSCGVYKGPNQHEIYDPLLRQVDIWPEFVSSGCQFEVAARRFVTLSRAACDAERAYRVGRVGRAFKT